MPRRFIEQNIDLIESGNYDALYDLAEQDLAQYQVGELTKILWDIGEHPEEELEYIPSSYFCEWEMREYHVPDNIKELRPFVFCHCEQLERVWLPKSVTKMGAGAFYGCDSLKTIYYEGSFKDARAIYMPPRIFNKAPRVEFVCGDGTVFHVGGTA